MAEDGTISFAETYKGPHALFTLSLDQSLADPAAVQDFFQANEIDPNPYPAEDIGKDVGYSLMTEGDGTSHLDWISGHDLSTIQWMTVEEFQAYMEAELEKMKQALKDGSLSQETFNMEKQDLEDTLTGLKNGTLMAGQIDGGLCVVDESEMENLSISFQTVGGTTAVIPEP